MAIKVLEIKKQLDEQRKLLSAIELRKKEFATREAELEQAIEQATEETKESVSAQVDAFNTEKAETEVEEANLRKVIADLEKEIDEIEENQPSNNEKNIERETSKMEKIEMRNTVEYRNAFANYIKTGDATEVRSLLTENVEGGVVPVPDLVYDIVKTAWDRETIMSGVLKTYLKGNVKVGFEISATGAVVHTEGSEAPAEETLTLGIVTMVPESIKKWITVSDEALDLSGDAFLQYIYDEITYQVAKKAANLVVGMIASAPTASTATATGQASITAGIALGTIAQAVANLSDEAGAPVVIMNKLTYADFKAAQYAGNFAVDIFEGLDVRFNNTLPAFSAATSGAVYAIVGDLKGVQANFPNGDEIKFTYDDKSLAERDLVKIVGREYVGLGLVKPFAFVNIKKPTVSADE